VSILTVKPLIEHLKELKSRLILVISLLAIFFVISLFLAPSFIRFVRNDLIVSEHVKLIVTRPVEFIFAELKVALLIALGFTLPLILYELIAFVKPGLTVKERNAIKLIMPSFILLFLCGIVFAYFIFIKVALYFFANLATIAGIANLWSLNSFISFIFYTALALGIIFQLPLFMIVLKKMGVVSPKFLVSKRRDIYILLLLIAAIITPPDIITQIIIVVPLILLYEASVVVMKFF
jgi:sec-independent protein translocase protein TatC